MWWVKVDVEPCCCVGAATHWWVTEVAGEVVGAGGPRGERGDKGDRGAEGGDLESVAERCVGGLCVCRLW
jgi:hypothetical protein